MELKNAHFLRNNIDNLALIDVDSKKLGGAIAD